MFEDECLVFGIPVQSEYREIAREAWRDIRLSIQHGPKDRAPADRARTELVLFLADHFRRRGVPRPIAAAWNVIGFPNGKEFARKLQPGQPLGDLAPSAVLKKFMPLVLGRLKHVRVAGDKDARAAAELGLLNALTGYDPAEDVSVGLYAKIHRLIDGEIKRQIRGKVSDACYHKPASGDEQAGQEKFDEGETDDRWEVMPKTALSDETIATIENAHDDLGRMKAVRLPFATAMWLAETSKRQSLAARFESLMDLPAAPQEMADYLTVIPVDKVASELTRLSELEQEIVTRRFYRNPPILLDAIARDKKLSYHRILTTAYRAVRQIGAGKPIKTKPPIRRPMREPPAPRQLPLRPHGPPDFRFRRVLEEISKIRFATRNSPSNQSKRVGP